MKVNQSGYVPAGFAVRTRIDDSMFTAEATEADVAAAVSDPRVESVERSHRLAGPTTGA